jgi:predicted  nucleic acid-binding Zn-ribbon protein
MIFKAVKLGAMVTGGALLAGGLIFGGELSSYVRSSARSVRVAVRDNIPVEFEIRRARDLLDELGPEMHNNIRAIAEQEVDVASLKHEIGENKISLTEERQRVEKLRDAVSGGQTQFTFGDMTFSRPQIVQELSRRFTHYKEAETALAARETLLLNRQKGLAAAEEALENAKAQKATLEAQIESLDAQYKVVQASSAGSDALPAFDQSKLAEAKKAVADIRRHLDVAEHVLAHEAQFTQDVPVVDTMSEQDLLKQVNAHLDGKSSSPAVAQGASAQPTE